MKRIFPATKDHRRAVADQVITEFCNRDRRHYLSMRLSGQFDWPNEFTKLNLFERDWLLWPNTKWDRPGIVIHCPEGNGENEAKLAMRFLSALCWLQNKKITDEGFWTVGTNVNPCFRDEPLPDSQYGTRHGLQIDEYDYLPFPVSEKAQIALALYREAVCLNEEPYKFLSFYKVMNVKIADWKGQVDWINANLDKISDHSSLQRLRALGTQLDIGHYLFVSGRCAVAHAWGEPFVNPDNPDDKRRLSADLPLIQALAKLMIEQEFGIKSSTTIYREHLNELAGFKSQLGAELVDLILNGYDLDEQGKSIVDLVEEHLPKLSVRLRGEKIFPYENLIARSVEYEAGKIALQCNSPDDLVEVFLELDLKNESLNFYPEGGFSVFDDGSARSAQLAYLHNLFLKNLYRNGSLEVWSEVGLLGRKSAYLPSNINMTVTDRNFQQAAMQFQQLSAWRALGWFSKFDNKRYKQVLLRQTAISKVGVFEQFRRRALSQPF